MKACRFEAVDATPVWLMRQAGRYMKEYRDLRARVPFLELCKNPALVSEVTVTAAEKLGVDAAIIFADLLLIVEPLGLHLEYDKGEGPVISPGLREAADIDRLQEVDPEESIGIFLRCHPPNALRPEFEASPHWICRLPIHPGFLPDRGWRFQELPPHQSSDVPRRGRMAGADGAPGTQSGPVY